MYWEDVRDIVTKGNQNWIQLASMFLFLLWNTWVLALSGHRICDQSVTETCHDLVCGLFFGWLGALTGSCTFVAQWPHVERMWQKQWLKDVSEQGARNASVCVCVCVPTPLCWRVSGPLAGECFAEVKPCRLLELSLLAAKHTHTNSLCALILQWLTSTPFLFCFVGGVKNWPAVSFYSTSALKASLCI